jgi:hypothetical protein
LILVLVFSSLLLYLTRTKYNTMNYESRIHQERNCPSLAEVAALIKNGTAKSFEALSINGFDGHKYFFVADAEFGSFYETAMIRQESDSSFVQIESITAGWIKTEADLEAAFRKSMIGKPYSKWSTQLNIGSAPKNAKANFTCGCCGSFFNGNIEFQKKFDQDDGYGICDDCASKYYSTSND